MVGKDQGSDQGSSGWVSTGVAAEILGVSSRSVRNYILNRSLAARKETEGINEKYLVSLASLICPARSAEDAGEISAQPPRFLTFGRNDGKHGGSREGYGRGHAEGDPHQSGGAHRQECRATGGRCRASRPLGAQRGAESALRSEEHTSELQSRQYLVCRLLLE